MTIEERRDIGSEQGVEVGQRRIHLNNRARGV